MGGAANPLLAFLILVGVSLSTYVERARKENKIIRGIIIASIIIILIVLLIRVSILSHSNVSGPVTIDYYNATLTYNGDGLIILKETYIYNIKSNKYHMLYRNFTSTLIPGPPEMLYKYWYPSIAVVSVQCPEDFKPYYVDYSGTAHVNLAEEEANEFFKLIRKYNVHNEAGCYRYPHIPKGKYKVTYVFLMRPPYTCGLDGCYTNLLLQSNRKAPIKHGVVTLEGFDYAAILPSGLVMNESTVGDKVRYELASLESRQALNILLYVDADRAGLIPPTSITSENPGEPVFPKVTYKARLSQQYALNAMFLEKVLFSSLLLVPFLIYIIYKLLGTERSIQYFVKRIPPYWDEKPWEVNALYGETPGLTDVNGISATIADLIGRGILRYEKEDSKVKLILPETVLGLDEYEAGVVELLKLLSDDGRTLDLEKLVHTKPGRIQKFKIGRVFGKLKKISRKRSAKAIDRKGNILLTILLVASITVGAAAFYYSLRADLHTETLLVISEIIGLIAILYPAVKAPYYVFGRFKGDGYARWLAWNWFRENVYNIESSIGPDVKDNENMMLRLAAYAIAVGRKDALTSGVFEKLADLTAIFDASNKIHYWYYNIYKPRRSSGGFSGGSGGFGGGGGGAR